MCFRRAEQSDALNFTLLNNPLCFTPILFGIYYAVYFSVKAIGGFCLTLINDYVAKEGLFLMLALGSQISYQVAMAFIHRTVSTFLGMYLRIKATRGV